MYIKKLITRITSPKLSGLAKQSAVRMKQYKDENVFKSSVLQELMTDTFEYRGDFKNTFLVKNRETGKPAELVVDIFQKPYIPSLHMIEESYVVTDPANNRIVGKKNYILKKFADGKFKMHQGEMENYNPMYAGVGVRLDQLQIERALQLGIDSIPRTSYPESILYHTKMGFLPSELDLEPVKNTLQLKNYVDEDFCKYIPKRYFQPVVVEKDGRFFLDTNKTLADASLRRSKDILAETGHHRILDLSPINVYMSLAGEELQKWKQLIKKHPLLEKFRYNFINDF